MQDNVQRVLALLGLARRSGNVVTGTTACRYAVTGGRAHLVVVAEDASARTRRDFVELARDAGVPSASVANKQQLGRATGSGPTAVCAVCDRNFAAGISEILGF